MSCWVAYTVDWWETRVLFEGAVPPPLPVGYAVVETDLPRDELQALVERASDGYDAAGQVRRLVAISGGRVRAA